MASRTDGDRIFNVGKTERMGNMKAFTAVAVFARDRLLQMMQDVFDRHSATVVHFLDRLNT